MAVHILIFVFGTIIGSFLNVLIFRYNTGESIIYAGSRCLICGKRLNWFELIPIFSFLFQKGRCRWCKSKISLQYPIVEAVTGIVFLLIFSARSGSAFGGNFQFSIFKEINFYFLLSTFYFLLIFSLLLVISVYDIRHQIIPNFFVYSLIILSFLNLFRIPALLLGRSNFEFRIYDFLAGLAFFAFFCLLWLVSKGQWMGLGDAKIALAIGWLLGSLNGFIAILFAFWTGALLGVFLLLFSSKKFKLKSKIPFGPFLSLSTFIAFLFGNNILQIYLNIIGRI